MKRTGTWTAVGSLIALIGVVAYLTTRRRAADEPVLVQEVSTADATANPAPQIDPASPPANEDSAARVALEREAPLTYWELERQKQGVVLAQFHGRLAYESTGQGVPWFTVTLNGGGSLVEHQTTDADGRFHSRLHFPMTSTRVILSDPLLYGYAEDGIEVKREDGEAEVRLAVRTAPTMVISGGLPPGVTPGKLTAMVLSGPGSYSSLKLRQGGEQWFVREDHADYDRHHDPKKVEEDARGKRAYYESVGREPPSEPDPSDVGPPTLRLETEYSTWKADVVIGAPEGVVYITPEWNSFGAIALSIRGKWEKPPTWSIEVDLSTGPEVPDEGMFVAHLNELHGEPMKLPRLEPGIYTMAVGGDLCDKLERQVIVRAGEVTDVEVELNCAASAGSIHGEITTQSGEALDEGSLHVWATNTKWSQSLDPKPVKGSAEWKATFDIPNVPAGDIEFSCYAGEFGTEPAKIVGRAGEVVRIRVLDRPQYIDLGFRVFDVESGAELETYTAYFWGNHADARGVPSGAIAVEHVPANARLGWSVTSPAHLCAKGIIAEQASWAKIEGSKRWIDVRLESGWRVEGCVMESESYRHLAGATIQADGVDVGTTDADGYFTLILPQKPKSMDARYRDWPLVEREMEAIEAMESCDSANFIFERKR